MRLKPNVLKTLEDSFSEPTQYTEVHVQTC